MSTYNNQEDLITYLYQKLTTNKNVSLVKDTTRLSKIKFDTFVDSTISAPLSFTVFELSDKGELIIDSAEKVAESEAAFFLFINPKNNWIFAVKNTLENQKKLIRGENLEQFKVKLL